MSSGEGELLMNREKLQSEEIQHAQCYGKSQCISWRDFFIQMQKHDKGELQEDGKVQAVLKAQGGVGVENNRQRVREKCDNTRESGLLQRNQLRDVNRGRDDDCGRLREQRSFVVSGETKTNGLFVFGSRWLFSHCGIQYRKNRRLPQGQPTVKIGNR